MLLDDDVVRITDHQTYRGEDIINVFYYVIEVLVAGITLLDVLLEFKDQVTGFTVPLQTTSLTHNTLVGENLTNGIDIETLIANMAGTDVGGGGESPAYVAAGFIFNVADKTTRPGGKRIGAIGEARVDGNDISFPGFELQDAADSFGAVQAVTGTPSGSGLITPVVVGRDPLGAIDLNRISVVSSVAAYSTIRSQVSRRAPAQ